MRAVIGELIDNRYAGATVERVAARAGVAKTTIYRRWRSMDGLLADLMAEHAAHQMPVPDEGSLDADLRALARAVVASVRNPAVRAAMASMIAAAVQDHAARHVLSGFLATRTAAMSTLIDHAVQRGELPAGTDAAGVLQTVTAVIYYRLFITAVIYYRLFIAGDPPSAELADRAGATAAAACAGVFAVRAPS
jgi:AcrR family transcriptional regulator